MSKSVAATLTSILTNSLYTKITDLTHDIVPTATQFVDDWSVDLYTRKPGPAVNENGEFQGTDLDLTTLLSALADRRAVVNLPTYKTMRAATKTEGEQIFSKDNRHGKITGCYSNQKCFSFGINIVDQNVIQVDKQTGEENVGAPRRFSVLNVKGEWHEGFKSLQFLPTAKENDFLNNHNLYTDNKIVVSNVVHPNRWISFYGQAYFNAKVLLERIDAEVQFLKGAIAALQAKGIAFPSSGVGSLKEWPSSKTVGAAQKIEVKNLEVEVDFPGFEGSFPVVPETQEGLVAAKDRQKLLEYTIKPMIAYATRCVEYAFFTYGYRDDAKTEEKFPAWISEASWERGYKLPSKRVEWNRLVLFQPGVGQQGVAIRYRVITSKQTIAADE